MKQTKLTFASENLVVDYLSLNIQGWVDPEPMAKYFFKAFGFNSTIVKRINGKWKPQVLKYDSRNQFQVSFRQYEYDPESKSFWVGSQIHFSGKNAAYLYSCIKEDRFDWNLLELQRISLGRFDLHYFRQSEARDSNQEIEDFMEKSCQRIGSKSKRIQASWTRTQKGRLLRIGSRSSSNFYRVYQKEKEVTYDVYSEVVDGLQFELELKNELVKSFQEFLFANQIEEFEDRLSQHFLKQSVKYLVLNFCYTNWLVKLLRKIVQRPKFNPSLVTDYLGKSKLNSFTDKESLFRFLQFLSFIRSLTGVKQFVDDQIYYLIKFPVADFIRFLGENPKSSYQRKKVLDFLNSLQGFPPLVEQFSEVEFRSSVMFPLVKLRKENRSWILKIAIGEQLYSYTYPFVFSGSLVYFQTKYDLIVKFEIIQVLSTNSLEKKFPVENFINQFRKNNRTQIKKLIINLLDELKNSKLIESRFNIVLKKGSPKRVENLTPLLITQSKDIYFYEIIDC
jgi:hypothetical protein